MDHKYYMREAIKEAEIALKEGNWPIGCILVLENKIISRNHNQVYTLENKLAHAEKLTLDSKRIQKILKENKYKATLYTTYEPCPMCFGAIILSRIKKVVAGVDADNSGAMHLKENLPLLFKNKELQVKFTPGILAKDCYDVFVKGKPTQALLNGGLLKKYTEL